MSDLLVTLTTDFGERDPYVAAMKGVLLSAVPGIRVIDLTHQIAPQDTFEAALFIAGAAPYFPAGTIHVAVVDPGVGTARHPIAVSAGGQIFVCPDNGLLTLYLRAHPLEAAHVISNPALMRYPVSPTFHGRDIFAPVAAHLAKGMPLAEVGGRLAKLAYLDIPEPVREDENRWKAAIIHVDRFGNAVTNLSRTQLGTEAITAICAGGHRFEQLCTTYGDVASGESLVLFGSTDYLEIAVRDGSAAAQLGLQAGTAVIVETGI